MDPKGIVHTSPAQRAGGAREAYGFLKGSLIHVWRSVSDGGREAHEASLQHAVVDPMDPGLLCRAGTKNTSFVFCHCEPPSAAVNSRQ